MKFLSVQMMIPSASVEFGEFVLMLICLVFYASDIIQESTAFFFIGLECLYRIYFPVLLSY